MHRLRDGLGIGLAVLALGLAVLACGTGNGGGGGGGGGSSNQQATVAALSTSLAQSGTAEVANSEGTRVASVATNEASLNQTAVAAAGTQAVLSAQEIEAQSGTATAIAPIMSDLPLYGVNPAEGRVAWVHPPATLDIEGFEQYDYVNEFLTVVAQDFVVSADITWNTRFGTSGCGLVLRTDGNEEALDQYMVIATRGANGHVFFAPMLDGEVIQSRIEDMYARGIDPLFTSANDTTNRLTVVARGSEFTIYTNGTQVGQIVDEDYARGFIALVALNQSGRTVCHFTNTWLWLFE